MTVEEIYQDRKKFSKTVFDVASSDLVNMGLTVVSYTLKDIKDDHGYLKALGMARTAQVWMTRFQPLGEKSTSAAISPLKTRQK